MTFNAVLVALVALTAILSPTTFLETNGLEITQYTINLMRAYGAIAVGYAVISWLMRREQAATAPGAFLIGAGVAYPVAAVVNVINITALPDLDTAIRWVFFGLNVVLGAAFLILSVREPAAERPIYLVLRLHPFQPCATA